MQQRTILWIYMFVIFFIISFLKRHILIMQSFQKENAYLVSYRYNSCLFYYNLIMILKYTDSQLAFKHKSYNSFLSFGEIISVAVKFASELLHIRYFSFWFIPQYILFIFCKTSEHFCFQLFSSKFSFFHPLLYFSSLGSLEGRVQDNKCLKYKFAWAQK